jgi:hypothetical protein
LQRCSIELFLRRDLIRAPEHLNASAHRGNAALLRATGS